MKIKLIKREDHPNIETFQKKYGDALIAAVVAFAGNAANRELSGTGDDPFIDDYDASLEHNITYFYNAYLKNETADTIQKWIKTDAEQPVDTTVENVNNFVDDWFRLPEDAQYKLWHQWETWVMRRINEQLADVMDRGPSNDGEEWD